MAAGQTEKPVDVFLLFTLAIGITIVSAMKVNFMVGIHRTGRAVCLETRSSYLHKSEAKTNSFVQTSHTSRVQFGFPPFRLATLTSTPGTQIEAPQSSANTVFLSQQGSWPSNHPARNNLTLSDPVTRVQPGTSQHVYTHDEPGENVGPPHSRFSLKSLSGLRIRVSTSYTGLPCIIARC